MKSRLFDYAIFVALILLVVLANRKVEKRVESSGNTQSALPEVTFSPPAHHVLYTKTNPKPLIGFAGEIPMVIALDEDEIIQEIKILENAETPAFMQAVMAQKYLDNWIGKSAKEMANTTVDGVTSATYTSEAIAGSIQQQLQQYYRVAEPDSKPIAYAKIGTLVAQLIVTLFAFLLFQYPAKFSKFRVQIFFLAVLVLGVWQGSMLSVTQFFNWTLNGMPSVWGIGLIVIGLLSLVLPFFTKKNFYCYHLCPFGLAQELVSRAVFHPVKWKFLTYKWLGHIRMAILLTCYLLVLIESGQYVAGFEPFSAFKYRTAPWMSVAIFFSMLVLSVFIKRPWCRFFCPCGALLDLFKRKSRLRSTPVVRSKQ